MSVITELRAQNVQRLKAVTIRMDGAPLVQITGKNAQGKTSVLDTIAIALGGKRFMSAKPVRDGAENAVIEVDLDDGMKIRRTITKSGSGSLTVTAADGSPLKTPQAILDRMAESLSFDPLAFTRMKPAEQVEALKRIIGLDFTDLDAKRAQVYTSRTTLNREIDSLKARVNATPHFPDAPASEVSVAELAERHKAGVKHNEKVGELYDDALDLDNSVSDTESVIAALKADLKAAEERLVTLLQDRATAKAQSDAAEKTRIDVDAIFIQMTSADAVNTKVRANTAYTKMTRELAGKVAEAAVMTGEIDEIDQAKRTALNEAKMPVEGMTFDDTGVIYNGQPFAQASGAEKLIVSFGMAVAAAPQLKVVLVRDGSLLDMDNLAIIAGLAEKAGAQLIIERVGTGGVGIEIVDGQVAE